MTAPVSQRHRLTALVRDLGKASAPDIIPLCPDLTADQIKRILNAAAHIGLLKRVGQIAPKSWGCGRPWAVYQATEKRPHVSNTQKVLDALRKHGGMTIEGIAACCPEMTRDSVIKAIHNASQSKQVYRAGLAEKIPGRRAPRHVIYAATGAQPQRAERDRPLPPRGRYGYLGKVSSVFEMGSLVG